MDWNDITAYFQNVGEKLELTKKKPGQVMTPGRYEMVQQFISDAEKNPNFGAVLHAPDMRQYIQEEKYDPTGQETTYNWHKAAKKIRTPSFSTEYPGTARPVWPFKD